LHIAKASSDRPGEESAAVYLARASRREHFLALTDGLLNRLLVGRSRRVSQDARPVGFSVPHAPIFLGAYSAVWLAELAGDKAPRTIGVVAARFWPASLMCGCGAAFMAKMLAAVLTGGAIARLPPTLVAGS
jgi:hypothetical protein